MKDNRLFRNVPVLLWWVAILVVLIRFPSAVFIIGLVLLAATPFSRMILDSSDVRPVPLCTINKFVELGSMTALSAVKAMVYEGKLPAPSTRKILDRSKEE